MAFTKINAAGIGSTETVTLDGLTVINDGSFGGNVSVGGTLTYEDVTNIDSVGLITARSGIEIGASPGVAASISADGNAIFSGITTVGGNADIEGALVVGNGVAAPLSGFSAHFHADATSNRIQITTSNTGVTNADGAIIMIDSGSNMEILNRENTNLEFFTNNSQHMTLDSSGRLLIGTTSNIAHANADNAIIAGSGNVGLSIHSTDSGRSSIYFADSSSSPGSYAGFIDFIHSDNSFLIGRGNDTSLTIDSAGTTTASGTSDGVFQLTTTDSRGAFIRFGQGGSYHNMVGCADGLTSGDKEDLGIRAADNIIFAAGGSTERARITSEGNIGIGNDASFPVYTHVNSRNFMLGTGGESTALQIHSSNSTYGGIYFGDVADRTDANSYIGGIEYKHGDDFMNLRVNGANRVRIDSSGRVLIGVTASYANASIDELQIGNNSSSNQSGLTIGSTDECAIAFADAGDARAGSITYNHGAESMIFKCNGQNEHLRIRGGGDVTTTGDSGFTRTTAGLTARKGDSVNIARASGTPLEVCRTGNTGNMINFFYGSSSVATISYNGSTMTYGGTSDYRLKENIVEMTGGIDAVKKLKPIKFNFITTPEKTVEGFIAHEVQEVIPQAVTGEKDCEVDEEGKGYQQLDPAQLVPTLTTALQESITRIETLEARIAALEG